MDFRKLNEIVSLRKAGLSESAAQASDTIFGAVSPFWKDLLSARPNFLSAEEFNSFRSPSTDSTLGIGGHKETAEALTLFDQSIREIVDASAVPDEIVNNICEPVLGSPIVRPYRENLFSTSYLNHIAGAWRIKRFIDKYGPKNRPLRICEIGAGYGAAANILHQILDVESYTIIDLPENLYLSSVFLSASLPDRSCQIVTPSRTQSLFCGAQLNFLLPAFTEVIKPCAFDLVVNRASLGEMPVNTAKSYISWVAARLANDGIFYFLNRFNVMHTQGAKRLSDFGLNALALRHLEPMERTSRPTNQIHCEIVASVGQSPSEVTANADVLADLIACGIDPQINDAIQAVVQNSASEELRNDLSTLSKVFSSSPVQPKIQLLQGLSSGPLKDVGRVLTRVCQLLSSVGASIDNSDILGLEIGLKMDVRLRGLIAEVEASAGLSTWAETLRPLKEKSLPLWKMSIGYIESGMPRFSAAFKRDLRVVDR